MHALLDSSVRLLLLGNLTKFIIKNTDSQAHVDKNIDSNVVAKFFKQMKFSGMVL